MLIKEDYKLLADGKERVIYYSNAGYMIKDTSANVLYESAIELKEAQTQYEETEILIEDYYKGANNSVLSE